MEERPNDTSLLKQKVFFWAKVWSSKNDTGPEVGLGPTKLTFLEYLLIGIASSTFGDVLLNRENRNRA